MKDKTKTWYRYRVKKGAVWSTWLHKEMTNGQIMKLTMKCFRKGWTLEAKAENE